MATFWASIAIGVVLGALAVGIPFWIAHRARGTSGLPHAHAYLDAKDEMARTADPAQRRRAYQEAEERLTRDA